MARSVDNSPFLAVANGLCRSVLNDCFGQVHNIQVLSALSKIDRAERMLGGLDARTLQELREVVRSRTHDGIMLVDEESIPDALAAETLGCKRRVYAHGD